MKRINNLVIGLILSLIITTCGTGRIGSLERKSDECIVIAKIYIKNYDEQISKSSKIVFKNIDSSSISVCPDDSNYIYMKLPLGKHYLSSIIYTVMMETRGIYLTDTLLNFDTPESRIYYLGDIYTVLSLDDNYNYGRYAKARFSKSNVTLPPIWIKNNINDAIRYFKSIFPNDENIIQCKFQSDTSNVLSENFFTDSSKAKKNPIENKHDLRIKHIK